MKTTFQKIKDSSINMGFVSIIDESLFDYVTLLYTFLRYYQLRILCVPSFVFVTS